MNNLFLWDDLVGSKHSLLFSFKEEKQQSFNPGVITEGAEVNEFSLPGHS